jgi:hypothetical protein
MGGFIVLGVFVAVAWWVVSLTGRPLQGRSILPQPSAHFGLS